MPYRLTFLTEPRKGLTIDFNQEIITIGRAAQNDLVIDEKHVSGHHAKISSNEGKFWVEDLGSTNGTFVNGTRVNAPTFLRVGDTIQLGTKTRLHFSPITQDFSDRTVIGSPNDLPDFASVPQAPPSIPLPNSRKKRFPSWIIFVVLGIVFLCITGVVLGGGGLIALNVFSNDEAETAQASEIGLLQTDQAFVKGTELAMTEAPQATGTALAVQAIQATKVVETQQAAATSIAATQQAQATANAQIQATADMIDMYWNISQNSMQGTPIYGPVSGLMAHTGDGNVSAFYADVDVMNAVITVDFYAPYDVSENQWDMGLFFRDQGRNDEFRLVVESSGYLYVLDQNGEEESYIIESHIQNVNLSLDQPNILTLVLWDGEAIFFLNGEFVMMFDVSARMMPGDIGVATTVMTENFIVGSETYYENFKVFNLSAE